MTFSPASYHFFLPQSKYSPHRPVPKYHPSIFQMYKRENEYKPIRTTNVPRELFAYNEILLRTRMLKVYNALPHSVTYLFSFKQLYLCMKTIKAYDRKHVQKIITEQCMDNEMWLHNYVHTSTQELLGDL
jgi:hypothetical protein